jgi:hypothetical protein
MPPLLHRRPCRLTLADVLELAWFFRRDQDLAEAEKHERDRDMALAHPQLQTDPERLCTWLDVRRQRSRDDARPPLADLQHVLHLLLFIVGLGMGVVTVGGWLSLDRLLPQDRSGADVNVIYFWSVTVGWQLLMLFLLIISLILGNWAAGVPGLAGLYRLLRWLPSLVPRLVGLLLQRLNPSRWHDLDVLQTWLTHSQRYRQLAYWYSLQLAQRFTIGLNLGCIGVFVFLSFATQPVFGWQSERLSCTDLARLTRVIALPWHWLGDWGVPSARDLRTTYHPPHPAHAHPDCLGEQGPVAPGWWPFLFASLVCYGLLPRMLLYGLAGWQVRRTVWHIALYHPDTRELLLRMARPVYTVHAGPSLSPIPLPAGTLTSTPEIPTGPRGRCVVFTWAGVQLDDAAISHLLQRQWGADMVARHQVGGLDISRDTAALKALDRQADIDQVMLLVEAWQPPVGDYLDFVTQLRHTLGDGPMIWVLLYHRDPHGQVLPPRPSDLEQWRQTLERADAWLRVKPLCEGA